MNNGMMKQFLLGAAVGTLAFLTPLILIGQQSSTDRNTTVQSSSTQSDQEPVWILPAFDQTTGSAGSVRPPGTHEFDSRSSRAAMEIKFKQPQSENISLPSELNSFPQQTGTAAKPADSSFPSGHERFKAYISGMFGPFAWVDAALSAGVGQIDNSPKEWGRGWSGYGKRFASSLGSHFTDDTVKYALSEALNEDSEFHRTTKPGFKAKAIDAALQAVTSRTSDGRRVFSVPRIAGDYAGGFVALAWKPSSYTVGSAISSGSLSILTTAGINLLLEYFPRKK